LDSKANQQKKIIINMHLDFTDTKIYIINSIAFAFTFTHADAFLKFLLTAVAIGYTTHKWYFMHIDRKERKNNEKKEQKNEEEN